MSLTGENNLTEVQFGKNVSKIGNSAFFNCTNLRTVSLNKGLSTIGSDAFVNCDSLTSITIPSSVMTVLTHAIGYKATGDYPNLVYSPVNIAITNNSEYPGVVNYISKYNLEYETAVENAKPDISSWNVSGIEDKEYTGSAITQNVVVSKGEETATINVSYKNNVEVGTATVIITGTGNYIGTITKTFEITAKSTGGNPSGNPTDPGTNSGSDPSGDTGSQPGSDKKDITLGKIDISSWDVTGIKDKEYTGAELKQSIVVSKDGSIATISVEYSNNVNAGTATVTITGTGDYTGTITKTFNIAKVDQDINVKTSTKTVKLKTVKKKKQTVAKAITITGAQGTVTYEKVSKGSSKNLTINKANGKITVKKKTKKGTYNIKVKVKSGASENVIIEIPFPKKGDVPMILAFPAVTNWQAERESLPEGWYTIPEEISED